MCKIHTERIVDGMDIYGAQNNIAKLLEYVTSVAQSGKTLYSPSKAKLRSIAETCKDVITVISSVLEEELLQTDIGEDPQHTKDYVEEVIRTMQKSLNTLSSFASVKSLPEEVEPVPGEIKPGGITTSQRKRIIKGYGDVLSNMQKSCGVTHMDASVDCINLLNRWFNTRFYVSVKHDSEFKYNIRRIPQWICDIIIAYGKHLKDNTISTFVSSFDSWLEKVKTSSVKYAVPYEVYKLNSSCNKADMTLEAAVLYDILYDMGLKDIRNVNSQADIGEQTVYNLCAKLNPDVLDRYRNYKSYPSILQECNISNFIDGGDVE